MDLLIIGNGFDIYHGLKTSYQDFKHYLLENDRSLYYDFMQFMTNIDDRWCHLEEELGNIDLFEIKDHVINSGGFKDYGADDWRDRDHHTHMQITGFLNNLIPRFWQYMNSEVVPEIENIDVTGSINEDTIVFNFNYTDTIMKYGVESDQIFYVHGSLDDQIILGHNGNRERTIEHEIINPSNIKYINEIMQEYDPREIELDEFLVDWKNSLLKNHVDNFRGCSFRFEEVDRIFIVGVSYNNIDFEYFKMIFEKTVKCSEIVLSYFTDVDFENMKCYLEKLNIDEELVKKYNDVDVILRQLYYTSVENSK